MSLNVDGMELEIRRAALALLPTEPNGVWTRSAGEENALGEVEEVVSTEVPVRVFCVKLRQAQGQFGSAGIEDQEQGRFLLAKSNDYTEDFNPENGEILTFDGYDYRSKSRRWLPVENAGYFEVEAVRC